VCASVISLRNFYYINFLSDALLRYNSFKDKLLVWPQLRIDNMKRTFFLLLSILGYFSCQVTQTIISIPEPSKIDGQRYKVWQNRTDTLQHTYLLNRVNKQFEQRRNTVNQTLVSKKAILARRDKMRQWYQERVGELPAKTPLNPSYSQKIELAAFTIEKVVFESQPNHHVTGLFYLPKTGKAPFPAVLIPCGHSTNGKAAESYQKAARLFAMNGFAVLQADPISQGERYQYVDENGQPLTRGGTKMHELLGQALLLTGSNTLIHQLTDNIRCLDFLEAHPKVDKNKLAVAGNSGGGTQVTYLVGYDDRIKVATPSCYIATTEKKFNTIGSQDGCQQLWGEGLMGIEEQDFLLMADNIPIRILSAEQDFFAIDGAKKAFQELKKQYTTLGIPEKVDMVTTNAKHGWHKPLREASVQWCKQWLLDDASPVTEPDDIGWITADSLVWATPKGQVMDAFKTEKTVIDLNKAQLKICGVNRRAFLESHNDTEIMEQVKQLIGYQALTNWQVETTEVWAESNFVMTKLVFQREQDVDFQLPALLFEPAKVNRKLPAMIVANEGGKAVNLVPNGLVEKVLNQGYIVLVIDVSNIGELKDGKKVHYENSEYWVAKLALYEGKTLLTYRTEDLVMAANYLAKHPKVDINNIELKADGLVGPAALHAGAISPRIKSVVTENSVMDWTTIAANYHTPNQLGNIVPNALHYYNLSDLLLIKMPNN